MYSRIQNFATQVIVVFFILFLSFDLTAQTTGGPSAFCHETDGQFTVCPGGSQEWSDIPFSFFPESNSYLYADQADLETAARLLT